jgi:hypothetical protein
MGENLVRVRVPDRYGTFEDAHGRSHGPGAIVEVSPRVAGLYGLTPEPEAAPAGKGKGKGA